MPEVRAQANLEYKSVERRRIYYFLQTTNTNNKLVSSAHYTGSRLIPSMECLPVLGRKRKRETTTPRTPSTTKRDQRSGICPFWNERTARWSEGFLPQVDSLGEPKSLPEISGSCFGAHVFPAATACRPNETWRAIIEPGLPPLPPTPVPVLAGRKRKTASMPSPEACVAEKTTKKKRKSKAPKLPAGKTRRLRIYPTKEQAGLLRGWMGTVRWTYNQAVDAINKDPTLERNEGGLRSMFVTKAAIKKLNTSEPSKRDYSWVLDTPSWPRVQAVADAVNAFKSNRAKQAKQNKKYKFQVKFRSRARDPQESIAFSSADWGRTRGIYAGLLNNKALRCCQSLPDKVEYDFEIAHVRATNKFFLCLPGPLEVHERDSSQPFRAIALDPGVRTFQTGYDCEGNAFEFGGERDEGRLFRLCKHLDELESRRTSLQKGSNPPRFLHKHKKRANMKRAASRLRERIRNIVDETHRKTSLWLCRNYDAVLIPEFQTARMAKRGEARCIGNKTARMMYTWAHFRFRQHLIHKAREHPWCRAVIVREDYTSKTCGRCGRINRKLGGNKIYTCPSCGYVADRDISAARNIFLRYLTERISCEPPVHNNNNGDLPLDGRPFEPCLPTSSSTASSINGIAVGGLVHVFSTVEGT